MGEKDSGEMLSGEEIVISGISGSFPLAGNTQQLIYNLQNKVDMITRFDHDNIKHPELPHYSGKLTNITNFDSHFFRFTNLQAVTFDPVGRQNMEQAFCALFDAGINPETLKGTKIGVFIGTSQSDAATFSLLNPKNNNIFSISGTSKAMLANRISYWLDGKGPSVSLDQGWTSSIACLELAVERIKSGECDSALVGGCSRALHPILFKNMRKGGLLCLDGKTKCFDKNGDGYVRSDAINIMFIQKAKDAKRIYTQIYDIKGKYFSTPDSTFLPTRNSEDISKFLQEFYTSVDVSPDEVEYVEASATGIAEADKTELEAIGNVFGKTKAIKVGSIKANMGHTEPASGICSLTKVCLSYQRGEIPPNIHYNEPHDIAAIRDGKATVVTENTKFNRSFTAINNFSYSGANYHVLLKGIYIPKDPKKYQSEIPRLVLASGRIDKSVTKILSLLEENPIDPEQIALLNNIFKYNIPGHTGRGYTVIETNDKNKTTCLARGFEIYDGNTRPIWFLYSGMGSQWPTMGAHLMRLSTFATAIERCDKVLRTKGLDIVKIITNDDHEIFNNILNSFVGITAIQIALTDVIKSMGITPGNIIGHSVGEIACAYADESLTLEEAILCAYLRGQVSRETKMIKGKMAAIGLGHKDVRNICPPEIDIACENSSKSTTISGPAEVVEQFVEQLTKQSVFARTVASSDIAFHSRYIADAGPSLFSKLRDVIKEPKLRTNKWLSTSYTPDKWSEESSLYASAEYFTHNLLSTVHFEQTANMIPKDAIVIEIAPHGLLQAIMKRSHENCKNISLTRRGEKDGIKLLLQSIGTLYQAGLNPDIDALYPKVSFPVSTETDVLSHFVDWDHSTKWHQDTFNDKEKINTVTYEFVMSILDDEYSYFKGCVNNGNIIFPEAATLVIVWKTLAMYNGKNYTDTSIEFSNVTFFDQIVIDGENTLRLLVEIQKGTNYFEVTHNNTIIASGFSITELSLGETFENIPFNESDYQLNENDIYKLMFAKGYNYEGQFKGIKSTNIERTKGLIKWNNNWITFLDSLLQLNRLSKSHNGVSDLKVVTKLVIDVEAHKILKKSTYLNDLDKDIYYGAQVFYDNAVTKCGGVLLTSINFKDIPVVEHITKEIQTKDLPHIPIQVKEKLFDVKLINAIVDGSNEYTWTEIPSPLDEETIQVVYSGINLSDSNKSATIGGNVNKYGVGFSGINARGEKVMGIVPDGSISSVVVPNGNFLWPVPKHWNFEEAATVPLPYIQAYYCLMIRENLRRKSNIYITNGDSAFGQAAISVCLSFDCTVFTTVSNVKNKAILMKTFRKLRDNHVACASDVVYFRYVVSNATKNQLCDIVINNESGSMRQEAMGFVGACSMFLDLCDQDMEKNQNYGMAFNKQEKTYKSVRLSNIFLTEYSSDCKKLRQMLSNGIADGSVKPLPRVIYSPDNISRAFKLLAANNICSVLINMTDLPVFKEKNEIVSRLKLSPTKLYIVVCDGSVLGIELIEHLVQRGAKRIVIHMKPKLMNGYFHVKYALWKKNDVDINFNSEDLHTKSACESLIGGKLEDIDGIFVTYTELTKSTPDEINQDNNNISLAIANLDMASRNCNLSYFAIIYNTRTECEGYAYSEIEKSCAKRFEIGLPSLVLRYKSNEEQNLPLSKLYNVLDTSLKKKYTCAFVSDTKSNDKEDKKNCIEDGLKAFFIKISNDEITAVEPIINMKTQLNNEMESELYRDPDDCCVLMIPGFDGIYEGMTSISERLKIPTVTLQLEPDLVTSIPDIAKSIFVHIKKTNRFNSGFYILGYSFGVNVALELAVLLEKEGHTGVVFCLDSSPDVFNHQLTAYTGNMTDKQLQNSIIEHFHNLLTGETSEKLKEDLANATEWSEKVNMFVNQVKTTVSYTHQYLKTLINAAFRRIVMAKEYKPDFKLNSEIVLIKGKPHPRSSKLSDDYGLSKYTKQTVKVFNIEADHATAPQDVCVSNIINKMLDPEILKDFENKNLCQYYFQ